MKEHALDLLPRVIDGLCASPALHSPGPKPHTEPLLAELLAHGSPKELCLSLEDQLQVAADEVAQCFHIDEDPEIREEQQEEREDKLDKSPDQKTLKNVCGRVIAVLDIHGSGKSRVPVLSSYCSSAPTVICRLEYKNRTAGLLMLGNFTERLDHFLGELMQALYAGESITVAQTRGLLVAIAKWCRAVSMWAAQLRPTDAESKDLRVGHSTHICRIVPLTTPFPSPGEARGSPPQISCPFAFKAGSRSTEQGVSSFVSGCHALPSDPASQGRDRCEGVDRLQERNHSQHL